MKIVIEFEKHERKTAEKIKDVVAKATGYLENEISWDGGKTRYEIDTKRPEKKGKKPF